MSMKIGLNSVSNVQKLGFAEGTEAAKEKAEIPVADSDSVTIKKAAEPPQVSNTRLFFSRLTDEQIKQVNEAGKLPKNAKFMNAQQGGSAYFIRPNWFNITVGTRTIPAGFELKKNFLGFTIVLPKDSEGLLIK